MIGILGSGFGLYGHLPAAVGCGHRVVLLERARPAFNERSELAPFKDGIEWIGTVDELLNAVSTLVLALPPGPQCDLALNAIQIDTISDLLLEKPLAPSPDLSRDLLLQLRASGKNFRINYSFLYSDWFHDLENIVREDPVSVTFKWHFRAHHYANALKNWKRASVSGGGAVNFFGIHLLAVAASLGFSELRRSDIGSHSAGDEASWRAELGGPSGGVLTLEVDSDSPEKRFEVSTTLRDRPVFSASTPFVTPRGETILDERVPILRKVYKDLFRSNTDDHLLKVYSETNRLWAAVIR